MDRACYVAMKTGTLFFLQAAALGGRVGGRLEVKVTPCCFFLSSSVDIKSSSIFHLSVFPVSIEYNLLVGLSCWSV